jgi:hypothetical protein
METLGPRFDYFHLPAEQTRGGVLVAWSSARWLASRTSSQTFSVSVRLGPSMGVPDWWLTSVYGPAHDTGKPAFLTELNELRQVLTGPWLIIGDFNMIYKSEDKNNGRLNRRLMGQFWCFINNAIVKEIHLTDWLYMRSSERSHPTLKRIDCTFFSNEWEDLFSNCELQALASLYSCSAPTLRFMGRVDSDSVPSSLNAMDTLRSFKGLGIVPSMEPTLSRGYTCC